MSPRSDPTLTLRDGGTLPEAGVEQIAETFARHLAMSEGGMAFSVYRAGEPVLRVHGGQAAPGRPWRPDTLAVLFSGTKGLVATVAARMIGRGLLDARAPVAEYWPEFAANGKADVRVHHVLSHSVGLPYVDPDPVDDAERLDNALMAQRLAAQPTVWEPGTEVGYHAITFGYLTAKILHRVSGQSIGTLIHRELAAPFDLDIHLGLPEAEEARVAPIHRGAGYRVSTFLQDDPERQAMVDRMYGPTLLGQELPMNTRPYHAAELAAGGGLATADAMARLYSLIVTPESRVVPAEALALATRAWSEGRDAINDRPVRFGLGYELDDPIGTYGPERPAFGHTGAGGGLHGAWPESGLGFSFLTNEMLSEDVDRRVKDLLGILADHGPDPGAGG